MRVSAICTSWAHLIVYRSFGHAEFLAMMTEQHGLGYHATMRTLFFLASLRPAHAQTAVGVGGMDFF